MCVPVSVNPRVLFSTPESSRFPTDPFPKWLRRIRSRVPRLLRLRSTFRPRTMYALRLRIMTGAFVPIKAKNRRGKSAISSEVFPGGLSKTLKRNHGTRDCRESRCGWLQASVRQIRHDASGSAVPWASGGSPDDGSFGHKMVHWISVCGGGREWGGDRWPSQGLS